MAHACEGGSEKKVAARGGLEEREAASVVGEMGDAPWAAVVRVSEDPLGPDRGLTAHLSSRDENP